MDFKKIRDGFKENTEWILREYGMDFQRIRDRYKDTIGWI